MPREIVLRILRSDVVEGYVLLNVIANGPSPLDLKLIATEGEAAYVGSGKSIRL